MERRVDEEADRRIMEREPQEPLTADPDEEDEALEGEDEAIETEDDVDQEEDDDG
jgi:hypothetical protein